jgi:hypothetical protein
MIKHAIYVNKDRYRASYKDAWIYKPGWIRFTGFAPVPVEELIPGGHRLFGVYNSYYADLFDKSAIESQHHARTSTLAPHMLVTQVILAGTQNKLTHVEVVARCDIPKFDEDIYSMTVHCDVYYEDRIKPGGASRWNFSLFGDVIDKLSSW